MILIYKFIKNIINQFMIFINSCIYLFIYSLFNILGILNVQ